MRPISTALTILILLGAGAPAKTPAPDAESGTSNDLFIMGGSDLVRPGLLPKANYNIGLGHTFGFLKKDPFGDELTSAYTYETPDRTVSCIPVSDRIPRRSA